MAKKHTWTIRFSIWTPILILICIFFMGGEHGWYTRAMVLFPWATLNSAWQDHLSKAFVIVGAFQFIVYCVVIDKSAGTNKQKFAVAGILISHIFLVILILMLRDAEWS